MKRVEDKELCEMTYHTKAVPGAQHAAPAAQKQLQEHDMLRRPHGSRHELNEISAASSVEWTEFSAMSCMR